MKNVRNKFLNQKGQALFEMIIFLPFLLFLYTIYYTAGNAINGSIDQQKAVRGYFYVLTKGNSYLSTYHDLTEFKKSNIGRVGFSAIGWRDHTENKKPLAPCFKFSSLLKSQSTEECNSSDRDNPGSSTFIRLFTFYGVCGATYTAEADGSFSTQPMAQAASGIFSCSLAPN